MADRKVKILSAAALFAACSTAMGVETFGPMPQAASDLLQMYPGTRVYQDDGHVRVIYGMPMTGGKTADEAAAAWVAQHSGAFGVGALSVAEEWVTPFKDNRFTVFTYKQFIDGIPVEFGMLKVLVLNAPTPRVVYAAGTLAPTPDRGLGAVTVTAEQAVATVRKMKPYARLMLTQPELTVFQGNGTWVAPVLTWKFMGDTGNPADQAGKTFFVNAQTGDLVYARHEVFDIDVNGVVTGNGSPGLWPDIASNPPVPLTMPNIKVGVTGGATGFADPNGAYLLTGVASPVTVNTGVGTASGFGGQWVNVVPTGSTALTANSGSVAPPAAANILLNPTPSQGLTAQVNGFIVTTKTHNYFKDRAPGFTGLDMVLRCNTGVSGTCNANYQSGNQSINFFNSGGGCPNTCYTTVISHEYGHFIVNRLNRPQGSFGEGYGDATAAMLWDSQETGLGFLGGTAALRDPIISNIQYPCSQEIHTCGMVVSGVWWRIRTAMGAFLGSQPGLAATQQLEVDWSLITLGGSGNDGMHPASAIEVLTVDDNDGNINNGTPNYSRICSAFSAHNIQCPVLTLLNFEYPSGRPASIPAGQPFTFPVNVVANAATPQPNTGMLSYRVNSGSFTTIPMVQNAANQYSATIPSTPCGNVVNYYVGAQTTSSFGVTDPTNAPTTYFSTIVGVIQNNTILNVDFDTAVPAGWSVSGLWNISGSCSPGGTACAGDQWAYYGVPATCNYSTGAAANSGSLTSPAIQLPPAVPGGQLQLSYCSSLQTENATSYDKATVLINGVQIERAPESANWQTRQIDISSYAGQSVTLSFKFETIDGVNNNFRGWQIDNVKIVGSTIACGTCYANCDGSTVPPILNVSDFTCFLNKYSAGDPYANCDGSTVPPILNVSDFTCFLNQYSAGCS